MDYAASNPYKKVKTLKTIGWIGGIGLACTGLGFIIVSGKSGSGIGSIFIAGGTAWSAVFLLSSNHTKKKIESQIYNSSVIHYDIPYSNGSSISLGVDLLSDHSISTNTLGLGLRYNF